MQKGGIRQKGRKKSQGRDTQHNAERNLHTKGAGISQRPPRSDRHFQHNTRQEQNKSP